MAQRIIRQREQFAANNLALSFIKPLVERWKDFWVMFMDWLIAPVGVRYYYGAPGAPKLSISSGMGMTKRKVKSSSPAEIWKLYEIFEDLQPEDIRNASRNLR